jgi:pyruvate kinase
MSAGFRRKKNVSAIGPATWKLEVFHQMVEDGTDAVRLNFFHTPHDVQPIFLKW